MATVTVRSISFLDGKAGVTNVHYDYTIDCTEAECDAGATLALTVSLTGVDKWYNDNLGGSMDLHTVTCERNSEGVCSVSGARTFPVATHVLDEDWGEDEIRLTLWAGDGNGLPARSKGPVSSNPPGRTDRGSGKTPEKRYSPSICARKRRASLSSWSAWARSGWSLKR